MSVAILIIAAVVVVVLWMEVRRLSAQSRQQADTLQTQLQGLRQETQAALNAQIGQATQTFNQQLGEVRATLQKGLTDAGQLASRSQQEVGQRLTETARLLSDVGKQLGGLQEAGRELRSTAHTLETVLSGARTRGSLGEVALERLLEDALPQDLYDLQHHFNTGAAVDAVVRLGDKVLPIDSKFPLDAYRRLADAADAEAQEPARREFARAVRKHADDIAAKYILPSEGTLELALMFVASESVYYEVLRTEDNKGRVDEYCRSQHVIPVSPNTLYAHLAVILMGLRGLQVEENARLLLGRLSGLQGELEAFMEVYGKLGTHLKNATQSHADASAKLEKLERSLAALAQGQLPEPAAPALAERTPK